MTEPVPSRETAPSRRSGNLTSWSDEAAGIVVSTSLASLGILLADRLWRPDWDFSWTDHWMGAPVLYLAPAAVIGLMWMGVRGVQDRVGRRFADPKRRDWARAGVVAALGSAASVPAAIKTFAGAKVSDTWLGAAGPPLFLLFVFVGVFSCTLLLRRSQRKVAWGRRSRALLIAPMFFLGGAGALWLDMHVYVGLYSHLHAFLEFCALGFFIGGFQLVGFVVVRAAPWMNWFNRGLAAGLLLLGLVYVSYRPLRTWTDARLAHAWVDEYYVGRALRRAQLMELRLSGGESLRVARVDHLARRFGLEDRTLDPAYLEPIPVKPPVAPIRNIVFFYVDTLRADVAADASLMPALAKFRGKALDFRRAYASGSDTLRSLPTITRGNYFIDKNHDGDLLRLAKGAGVHRHLILAESAHSFLSKLLPTFEFDRVETVLDHDEGKKVWGYGAHLSTAAGVGDRTVKFLRSDKATKPFLLWAFHFDAHAWREIDEEYITQSRERFGVPEEGEINVRYRVIARSMDEQFARLIKVLRDTGRDKDTAVVFISDHGEGLGQAGFWVHGIFLWESLIHVPLVVRLPGVAPQAVETPVSLVDVAPTLAGAFGESTAVYHGENLIDVAQGAERRLPILLRAGKFQGHGRAGVLDAGVKRKLLVRLEAAFPELHAYEVDPLDENNLAEQEPKNRQQLLKVLARSPVFPRGEKDFKLDSTPEELTAHTH